jgi:hypothetical protein
MEGHPGPIGGSALTEKVHTIMTATRNDKGFSAARHSFSGRTVLALLVVVAASACAKSPTEPSGDRGNGGSSATVTSVVITGDLSVSEGGSTQLTATAMLSNGMQQNVTSSATWTSTDTAVATVSGTGLVTSRTKGTADISAVYQGRTARATARVEAASYRLEVAIESVTALDTCDDFTQGLGSGEFAVRVLAIETNGGQTTLVNSGSYPGNPDNLRVYNLGRNESQSLSARRTFTIAGTDGQFLRLQFNATEWDEQIVIFPPSTRWVPDSDMNNRSATRTHTFSGGSFGNLGPNTLTLGNSSCGIRLNYTVSATRQ